MDLHFTLTAERHDEHAHGLLGELSFINTVSDDQIVPGNSINFRLSVLLENLTLFELFHICQHQCLILHNLYAMLQFVLSNYLWL